MSHTLTRPYRLLFDEVTGKRYATYSVYDYFVEGEGRDDSVNVVFRFDVDFGVGEAEQLAQELVEREIEGTFYFLTDPELHYDIWATEVPEIVAGMDFEVGIHTDHYYKQLTTGEDALDGISADVERLESMIGRPVHGMVFHGHDGIDELDTTNRVVYRDVPPEDLDLDYHDGFTSTYATEDEQFSADVEFQLSDFMGVINSWQYYPRLPVRWLSAAEPGETVHFYIHPGNVFSPKVRGPLRDKLIAFGRVNQYRLKSPVRNC